MTMELELRRLRSVLDVESVYTAFVESYDKSFNFPGESHDIWEIGVVFSGCVGITSGAEVYECHPGEVIIHPPGVFHTAWAKDESGVRLMTVTFTARGASRYIPAGKFVLTQSERTLASLLGELIEREIGNTYPVQVTLRPETEQTLKNYVEAFCLSLHARRDQTASPDKEERAALFAEIVGYLQAHVDDALSAENICVGCGIGRTALKELFRRYTGTGVMHYYNHLRLRRIIERMSEGEKLRQIAEGMHFSSQNYLTDFFRRQTGVPPSEYFNRT
jgi:AraC-like DNA-binding protein